MKEETIIRFLRKNGIKVTHCSSCHEDFEEGYDYLLEMYFTKKRMAFVCCSITNAWDELLKIKPEYKKLED